MTYKLYYSPGACSLAAHIILCESGLDFVTEKVNLKTKITQSDQDYLTINPKGYVPALKLEDGQVITEVAVILEYIARRVLGAGLIPKDDTLERYRCQEWLNYIATELHKKMGALFQTDIPQSYKESLLKILNRNFDFLASNLKTKSFLMGNHFMIPDAYLFTVLRWAPYLKVELKLWPVLTEYVERISKLPSVQTALIAENLLK